MLKENPLNYLVIMLKGFILLSHGEQHLSQKTTFTKEIPTEDTENWPIPILRINNSYE